MKKNFLNLILAGALSLSIQSCHAQKIVVNREVETTDNGKMLLGSQTLDQFKKEPYSEWYDKEYNDYQLDQKSISELKKEKLSTYSMTVFLGTWCGDSHREFPRLIKILEASNYNFGKMEIIAVNRKKESPNGEEGIYNIQRVPTIILKKYGKEIGRIIESPETGFLERDLLNILKKDGNKSKKSDE